MFENAGVPPQQPSSVLTAAQLEQPNRYCFIESDTIWHQVTVARPSFLIPVTGTPVIRFRPENWKSNSLTNSEYYTGRSGVAFLFTPGRWFINLPLAGSIAATVCLVRLDASDTITAQMISIMGLGSSAPASMIDVTKWGGTSQTGADLSVLWAAHYATRAMAAPAAHAFSTTATEVVLAGSATRKFLYVRNTSSAGETVSLGFGASAVLNSGITLKPTEWVSFDYSNGLTVQAVNGIASVATATLALQVA